MAGLSNGNGTSVGLELTPVSGMSLGNELTFLGFAVKPSVTLDFTTSFSTSSASLSRTGNARMFDSTGTMTFAPNNLLLNSATLSTQNITTVAGNYIISMYGTGSITLSGTSSGTITGTGANNQVYLKITAIAGTLTLTVSGSVTFAVAAQVTYETTPRSGDQVITTGSAYYGPRLDYNPSTLVALGLLIEGSASNYILQSQNLALTWTQRGVTLTTGNTGPDGITALSRVTLGASGSQDIFQYRSAAFPPSSRIEPSFWIYKTSTTGTMQIQNAYTGAAAGLWSINLATLPAGLVRVTRNTTGVTVTNEFTSDASGNCGIGFYMASGTGTVDIGFVNMENNSFTTSYIQTFAATVTRAADIAAITSATALAAKAIIIQVNGLPGSNADTLIGLNAGIGLGATAANALTTAWGGSQTTGTTATWTGTNRAGIAFNNGRVSISLNGSAVTTAANTPAALANIWLGNTNNGASGFLNGHVSQVYAYSTLTDAQLVARTPVGAAP